MLRLNVMPVFKARGIDNPYYFLIKQGLSPYTVNNILYKGTLSFNLNHVELLCKVLVCEPNDLLVWTPEKNQFYPENHPLQKLKLKATPIDVQQTLSTIPYKDLVEISNQIKVLQNLEPKPAGDFEPETK